ncbi:MAG: sulfite exporter TauE/SafE family protein [Planctomycetaceae bacterium]|nr:sulfite exporter TauE/SafE family protein [Planctomycetaceae bacterium]
MIEYVYLPILFFAAAILYSAVGHGGASAYLALMGVFQLAPVVMRPSALVMNIFVASIGAVRFYRAGSFSWRVFLPFAAGSVPLAFLGGAKKLDDALYLQLVAASLLAGAYPLLTATRAKIIEQSRPIPMALAVVCGAAIGYLSGLTGVGGGIFLTPLLIFSRWAETKRSAGVSAGFVLVNSIAGLAGNPQSLVEVPQALSLWVVAAIAGGLIGSQLGSRTISNVTLRRLLGVTLLIAAASLVKDSFSKSTPASSPGTFHPSDRRQPAPRTR